MEHKSKHENQRCQFLVLTHPNEGDTFSEMNSPVPKLTTHSIGISGYIVLASWIATAAGLDATKPPSLYISVPSKTGLKTVGAAVVARSAAL